MAANGRRCRVPLQGSGVMGQAAVVGAVPPACRSARSICVYLRPFAFICVESCFGPAAHRQGPPWERIGWGVEGRPGARLVGRLAGGAGRAGTAALGGVARSDVAGGRAGGVTRRARACAGAGMDPSPEWTAGARGRGWCRRIASIQTQRREGEEDRDHRGRSVGRGRVRPCLGGGVGALARGACAALCDLSLPRLCFSVFE